MAFQPASRTLILRGLTCLLSLVGLALLLAPVAAGTASATEADVPEAPRHLRVSPGESGELVVSWEAPTADGGSAISGYKVQWKSGSEDYDGAPGSIRQATTGNDPLTYTISDLKNGTEYTVRVIATNGAGDGAPSAEATATPRPPPTPEGQSAGSKGGSGEDGVYTWRDGDRIIPVRIETKRAVQGRTGRRSDVEGEDDYRTESIVSVSVGGDTMSLPGGVLVVLNPAWSQSRTDAFFSKNGIAPGSVSRLESMNNTFVVDTAPGLPSLRLANALATQDGVRVSSPNWQMEVETQQDSDQDDHGDTMETATALALDTPTPGSINGGGDDDVDFFRFVLAESTYVVVGNHSLAPTANGFLYFGNSFTILDNDGNRLKDGGWTRLRLSAGTYYVRVGWYPDGYHRQHYHVEVKTIDDHGDTMDNAYPVGSGHTNEPSPRVFRDFHSPTDVDFFKFELDETTEVIINAGEGLHHPRWGSISGINMEVLDSSGDALRPPIEGVSVFGRPYRLKAGTYYIRLSPYFFNGRPYGVNHPYQGDLVISTNVEYTEFINDCSAIQSSFDDPLYGCQWHLDNTSSNPRKRGQDANVTAAWSTTQGAGVNVVIVDDENEFGHEDLNANWNPVLSHDYLDSDMLHNPRARHGLAVAGVIAAQGNALGGRGVAPQATIFGYNLRERSNLANAIDAMTRNSSATAVSNNSWVFSNYKGTQLIPQLWDTALETGITDGFHGKGTFYVFGAGNHHLDGFHVNLSEAKNHYAQTLVCAVTPDGTRAKRSETGYSLWLCAPEASVTTDLWSRYRDDFGGTSAATAVVSGVAALLRSANVSLTWRDLKLILAASARKNDAEDRVWETGAFKYGSGSERYSYNPEYGFGVVDAGAAVALATNWTNLPHMDSVTAHGPAEDIPIPDRTWGEVFMNDVTPITSEITLNTDITFTEFVEVRVDITHPAFRDIGITLTSPSGATSHLAIPSDIAPDDELNTKFRLGSARHLGENASGSWKLEIADHQPNITGSFKGWEITIYGHRGNLKVNTPANGVPAITGTAQVGQTLTASTSGISDDDGLTGVNFAYQWIANAGTADNDIPGATASTYTLADTDQSKTIKVRVSFTDDSGNEESLTSSATQAVVSVDIEPSEAGICDRTEKVQEAILAKLSEVTDCANVTAAHLSSITGTLSLRESGMSSFQEGDFDQLDSLRELYLGHNSLAELPDGIFDNLTSLQRLYLGNNELSELPDGVFDSLINLTELGLGNNSLGELPDGVFDGQSDLEELYLGENSLSELPDGIFDNLTSLQRLYLGNNELSELPDGVFDSLTNLTELGLGNNSLSELSDGAFNKLADLEELYLPENSLDQLPLGVFEGLSNLQQLHLQDNPGVPFAFAADLVKVAADTMAVQVAQGAPFKMNIALSATDGTLSDTSITIPAGVIRSGSVVVTARGPDPVTVSVVTTAFDGGTYQGIQTRAGESLTLGGSAATNSPATGAPAIAGILQVGETLTADTSHISDADGLTNVSYSYQWLSSRDTDIQGATNSTYTLVADDVGKAVKVRVAFTDDSGNEESLTSAATDTVVAALPPPPDNVRAVTQESGAVELTWEAPQDATVTGYRIERRGADEQRSDGRARDNHTLVEDTGNTETGYTDKSAEKGVEYEYQVSAHNEAGAGEASDWVRAGPESASNNPATGAPTIRGTAQVGETLTAGITGIADADGLSGETFTYQWVSGDGTAGTDIENATGSTYTLADADQGKAIKVRVTFTDDGGNEETLTSAPTGPVWGDGPPGAPRNLTAAVGNKEVTLSWDPPEDNGNAPATGYRIEWRVDGKDYDKTIWGTAQSTTYKTNDRANLANGVKYFFRVKAENGGGNSYGPYGPASEEVSATPTSGSAVDLGTPVLSDTENLHHGMVRLDWEDVEDAGWYVVQYYHVQGGEWLDLPAEGVDIAFHGSSAVVSNLHGLSWLRVGAMSCAGASEWSQIEQLFGTNESDWEGVPVPEVAEGDEIEPCPVVLGTPVLSGTEDLHPGMVQLDWQDIEDASWYVVQYYHLDGGSGEWVGLPAEGVDIAFHGSSAVVSNLQGLSWLRVRAMSCDGTSEWSQIEQWFGTNASDWEDVPVPEVPEGDEIEPCSEDADTPDNSPATGAPTINGTAQVGETLEANTSGIADADGLSSVQYEYQWLADDADISEAPNATYTLVAADEGQVIKVRVSFTDDAGNEESLTSAATDAVAAAPTPNSPATGAPTIAGTVQVGETLTANTSGIADEDGLTNATHSFQWLADDTEIAGATSLTYTLVAADEGKAIKVQVSFTDDAGNEERLTSAATDAVAPQPQTNSPATGAPTISGTAQVGETLEADTSGIADADGLSNVQYEHQWLADDTDIAGATGLTYAPVAADEGKVIKVEVSFNDDAGNDESLTSAATDAVAAEPTPNSPATGAPTITGTAQVGETLTADMSGIADTDGLGSVQYEYQWLADDTEIAGATNATYTLAAADEGKAIKVQVSFTDDAGNEERLTSAATDAVAAEPSEPTEPPDKPKGLDATATHDSVTLTWKDPQDDSVTGYVILRRVRVNDQGGDFSVLVANTATAATSYTDNEVAASTTYTYRIKAINEHGVSERSRWVHIDTPAPPVPDKPTGLEATVSNGQVVLTWDDPDDDSITGYVILRRLPGVDPEGQFDELVADTGTAATTYTDSSVEAETRYTYRIKAINEHGTSERSRWYHIDTPAAP